MSEIDRAELRRLLAEATPRPWEVGSDGTSVREQDGFTNIHAVPAEDAALIAAAINALPGLLDALEKAERLRGSAESVRATVRAERVQLAAPIERVRELHTPGDEWCNFHNSALCECANVYCNVYCEGCSEEWPCPTIQALDGGE